MARKAGPWQHTTTDVARVEDPSAKRAIRVLEDQIRQLVVRLADLERRVAALEP